MAITGAIDGPGSGVVGPSLGGSGSGLTALTADTTFYVTTTGSDVLGHGTQASPWATPNFALNWIAKNVYANGFNITVQVGTPGIGGQIFTLTAPLFLPAIAGCNGFPDYPTDPLTPPINSATLIGDTGTPSNIRLSYSSGTGGPSIINVYQNATAWSIDGFDLNSTRSGITVANAGGVLGNVVFSGGHADECIFLFQNADLNLSGTTTINQATSGPLLHAYDSNFWAGGNAITFTQNPTLFSPGFIVLQDLSYGDFNGLTFVNPSYATGPQFNITRGAFVDARGSTTPTKATWPGNSAGTIDTLSVFLGDPIAQLSVPAVVAFADLPTSPTTGELLNISNANVNTWGTSVTGTGAFNVLARYNGAAWTVVGI